VCVTDIVIIISVHGTVKARTDDLFPQEQTR
jgi:hypothetical protein